MIEEPSTSSMLDDRRRPGSDSDILDNRNGTNKQEYLAYHQRPSVVANHSAISESTSFRHNKPVYIWTQAEVSRWLKQNIPNCQTVYCHMFANHDITGKTLLALDDKKLERIGIKDPNHRANILNEILKLLMKNYMHCFKGLQNAGMFELP